MLSSFVLLAAATAFSVAPARYGSVDREGETAAFVCSGAVGQVTCTVCDGWYRPILEREFPVNEAGMARMSFPWPSVRERYGAYRLQLKDGAGKERETWFAFLPGKRPAAPDRFYGTGCHVGQNFEKWTLDHIDLIAEVGIGAVRDDLYVENWEDGKGGFRIPEKFEAYVKALEKRGIWLNAVMTVRRPWTKEKLAPERYEKWSELLSRSYTGRKVGFEIWNEPHNFAFKPAYGGSYGGPDAVWIPKFVEFTHRVGDVFKRTKSDCPILLTAEDFLPSFLPMIDQGVAVRGDVVSIHPYCHGDPHPEKGTWFFDDDGRMIRERFAQHGGCDRFVASEAGWTTVSTTGKVEHAFVGCYPVVTHVQQAQYIQRMYVIARQLGLEQAFQYDFINDGCNRFFTEHNFGLLNEDRSPKPSYAATAAQILILGNAIPLGDEGGDRMRLRMYRFLARNGRTVYAAWGVMGPTEAEVPVPLKGAFSMFDMFGNPLPRPTDGKLKLTEEPVYLVSSVPVDGFDLVRPSLEGVRHVHVPASGDLTGWNAVQFALSPDKGSFIVSRHLNAESDSSVFRLRGLKPEGVYVFTDVISGAQRTVSGAILAEVGFKVSLPEKGTYAMFTYQRAWDLPPVLRIKGKMNVPQDVETDSLKPFTVLRPIPDRLRDENRHYQSCPSITASAGGRLWLTFMTGDRSEGDENVFMTVTSGDGGETWSKPIFAVDCPGPLRVLDSGMWTDPKGRVWFYYSQVFGFWDGRAGLWVMEAQDPESPETAWTPARRICDGYMKNKPTVLKDGRILLPVEFFEPAYSGFAGLWGRFVSMPERFLHDCSRYDYANVFVASDGLEKVSFLGQSRHSPKEHAFPENMVVERRDGTLWMLSRMRYGIGEAVSADGGKTWTDTVPSKIPSPSSRFYLGKLKSGALLLVKNGDMKNAKGRNRICAFVSDDDGATWKGGLELDGRDNVSYPDAVQGGDGTIHVVHDFDREGKCEIVHHRFSEADVRAGKLVTAGSRLGTLANKAGAK